MKADDIVVGALAGSLASAVLKLAVAEAEKVYVFDQVVTELKSTMTLLFPIITQIEPMLNEDELKNLKTINTRALAVLGKCSGVHGWDAVHKHIYVREIAIINSDMLKFCHIIVQLLQFRNQLQSSEANGRNFQILNDKLDHLTVSVSPPPVPTLDIQYRNLLQCIEANHKQCMEAIDMNFQVVHEKLDSLAVSLPDLCSDLHKNQLESTEAIDKNFQVVNDKLDHLAVSPSVYRRYLCSVPTLDFVPVGLDWPLKELKTRLLDDSLISLGVSAPPGCGKTTLVTQLCNDEDIKKKFNHIFFTVASKTPNFMSIVQDLLEHNGEAAHTFRNNTQAKDALRNLLMKLTEERHSVLLVLDDVWLGEQFSFLENFEFNLPAYKILVTSRSEFKTLSSTYHLKLLKDEDARSLLIHWAPQPSHASQAEYEDLLQKILKRCNGFPLVIKVLGASLRGQPLYVWKGQVESWSKGKTILDNYVMDRLQPSFEALEPPRLKECFMDMGSFLEDQKIRASVIIDLWAELYGIGSSEYMKYLKDLASHNLLQLIPLGGNEPEDGFYNDFLVTQHDILRDLSIHQSKFKEERNQTRLNLEIREDEFPDWCLDLMGPIDARILSISTDDLFLSKWEEMKSMNCPNVEALILNISSSNYALPNFITTMKKLKVVVIINHGPNPAKLKCLNLLTNLKRIRRIRLEKVSISLLDILRLQLHSLRKLSLVMCRFGEVSHDTQVTNACDALPSLQEIDIDYCYDLVELPIWVYEVVSLKTLSITNCNKLTKLQEAIGKWSKLEVLRLSSCINLSELPETSVTLSNLWFLDISDCLGIKKLPLEIGNLQKLRKISMRKCSKCELPDSVTKLENLVVQCDEETASLWERLKPKMRNLEVHQVETVHNLNMFKMFK